MFKNYIIITIKALIAFTLIFPGCTDPAANTPAAPDFTILANGVPGKIRTTELTVTFNKAIPGLTPDKFLIIADTGEAKVLNIANAGNTIYKLGIDVIQAGNILVQVTRPEFKKIIKTVNVHDLEPVPPAITYTVMADGMANTATSAFLTFYFSEEVPFLAAANITVSNGTGAGAGAAFRGDLVMDGSTGYLYISRIAQGNISVSINKSGIETGSKTVAVYRGAPITYTVTADGAAGTETTSKIIFTFSEEPPTNFAVGDITVTNGTGAAVRGELSGTGLTRELTVSGIIQGDISVTIARASIETAVKTVAVYMGGQITYAVTVKPRGAILEEQE